MAVDNHLVAVSSIAADSPLPSPPLHMGGAPGVNVDSPGQAAYRFLTQRRTHTMSVMCSLAVCKAQTGMCGHEKAMLSVAVLAAIGIGAYFLILG